MQKTKPKSSNELARGSDSFFVAVDTPLRKKKPLSGQKPQQAQGDMQRVMQALGSLVETAEIDRWLAAPNRMLSGVRPADAIRNGGVEQVLEILARVQEGIHV